MNYRRKIYIIGGIILLLLLVTGFWIYRSRLKQKSLPPPAAVPSVSQSQVPPPDNSVAPASVTVRLFADPVADFATRVSKKPFGIYVTPKSSPVQPERFTGYHTGADAEYQDVVQDVPVFAFADGVIVLSRTVSGYGGVFMLEFDLNGVKHTALYGHIRPSSLPKVDSHVTKGQHITLLGTGFSVETDGERRHLHFAILSDNRLDLAGYVSSKSQLAGWLDPLKIINESNTK